jgi:hypothetical protein
MSILIYLETVCFLSLFNHIWFKTDFLPYYLKALKSKLPFMFYQWFMCDEFFNRPSEDFIYSGYIEYLSAKRQFTNNFIISFLLKLFSCPICLTVWTSLISSILIGNVFLCGCIFVSVRLIDGLLNFFLKIH